MAKLDKRMVEGHDAKVEEKASAEGQEVDMSEKIPDIGDPHLDQYPIASDYLESDEKSDADPEKKISEEENEKRISQEIPHNEDRRVKLGRKSVKLKMKVS